MLTTRTDPRVLRLTHRRQYSAPPPPKPYTFRARPFLFTTTFVLLYQGIGVVSAFSVYEYFKHTNSSTHLLGGPLAVKILSLHLPFSHGERTVEDLVDMALRGSIKRGWGFWNKWKGRKEEVGEGDELADEVLKELEGKKRWNQKLAERAASVKDAVLSERGQSAGRFRDRIGGMVAGLKEKYQGGELGESGATKAQELKETALEQWRVRRERLPAVTDIVERKQGTLKKVTDAAAAYFILKAIFPVRLGLTVLLTPRLARFVGRRWF